MKKKLLIALPPRQLKAFCSEKQIERLCRDYEVSYPTRWDTPDWDGDEEKLESAEILFTGWRAKMLPQWYQGSNLQIVLIAAGNMAPYIPYVPSQAKLIGAGEALGFGVAEYCISMLINAAKRIHWLAVGTRKGGWRDEDIGFGPWFELYGNSVGIIGFGHAGRALARLLRPFDCRVKVYDPYVSKEEIEAMGATYEENLTELFSSCRSVCLLAALTKESRGLLGAEHFSKLPDGAVFLNAARAPIIREEEFIQELKKKRFVAVIDVANQEPPDLDHPFRKLPNVILSPHIAGAVADNRRRMGDYLIRALYAHENNLLFDSVLR